MYRVPTKRYPLTYTYPLVKTQCKTVFLLGKCMAKDTFFTGTQYIKKKVKYTFLRNEFEKNEEYEPHH